MRDNKMHSHRKMPELLLIWSFFLISFFSMSFIVYGECDHVLNNSCKDYKCTYVDANHHQISGYFDSCGEYVKMLADHKLSSNIKYVEYNDSFHKITGYCGRCESFNAEQIEAHNFQEKPEWVTYKDQGKVNDRYHGRMFKCANCGNKKVVDEEHSYGPWKVSKEATCAETGLKIRPCWHCEYVLEETIPSTENHKWSSWVITNKGNCLTEGLKERTCLTCGKVETEAIPVIGAHDWKNWKTVKEPTVFETGEEIRTCYNCEESETRAVEKIKAYAKFKKSCYTLTAGKTLSLSSKVQKGRGDSVKKWKSSRRKIATVSSSGKVKAKKKGTAKITVILKSGEKATVKIKVNEKKKKSSGGGVVYWVDNGSVYHYSINCPTLARSTNIHSGTIAKSRKSRACKVCG